MAQKLRRLGITRVRPLLGGFEAWRALGFPVEPVARRAEPAPEVPDPALPGAGPA